MHMVVPVSSGTQENSPLAKNQIPMLAGSFKGIVSEQHGTNQQSQIYQNQSQQQIKAKSQQQGKSFIKRKPSVTNSKGQISVINKQ